jgi:hypothetical protein
MSEPSMDPTRVGNLPEPTCRTCPHLVTIGTYDPECAFSTPFTVDDPDNTWCGDHPGRHDGIYMTFDEEMSE